MSLAVKKTVKVVNELINNTGLLGTPFLSAEPGQVSDINFDSNGDIVPQEQQGGTVSGNTFCDTGCNSLSASHEDDVPVKTQVKVSLGAPQAKIADALQNLLKLGFETRLGGLFLLIPFLLQSRLERFANMLWPAKKKGLQPVQALLLMIFATLGGLKRLSKLPCCQDIGLAVLAGLPKLPSSALMHQFLDQVKPGQLAKTKLSLARLLRRMGIIPGRIINIDMHVTEYFGKEHLPQGHH